MDLLNLTYRKTLCTGAARNANGLRISAWLKPEFPTVTPPLCSPAPKPENTKKTGFGAELKPERMINFN